MNARIAALLAVLLIAGCATRTEEPAVSRAPEKAAAGEKKPAAAPPSAASSATTVDAYKRDLAQRISELSAARVYPGRPQALLRSVVVVRYAVDARGNLLRSEIMRSNRDNETEKIALNSLRSAAPFPKPHANLLRRGQLELAETWLFNNDGRFQLRTIAQPQMDR